jgi:hypothetical protein
MADTEQLLFLCSPAAALVREPMADLVVGVDAGGQVIFLLVLIVSIRRRWRPSLARRDIEEYERKVRAELAAISHFKAA